MKILLIYLMLLAVMSIIALIMYKADKSKAVKGKWRIKEATLLSLGFFGGAVGAILGMKLFRHKTKHWYFWFVNIIGLAWQIGVAVMIMVKFV